MTSIGYGPLWRVDGPPPLAPLYGLLSAADAPAAGVRIVVDVDDRGIERWINGVQVYGYPPDPGSMFDACNPSLASGGPTPKGFGSDLVNPEFSAVTAYIAETCTSSHVWDQDAYKARAVQALTAVESSIVARQLMNGEGVLNNPHLADGQGQFPNVDVATSPIGALMLLEKAIGLTGRQGIIHVSPAMSVAMQDKMNFDTKTGVLRTINGTVVIPDAGYSGGSQPSGHAAPTGTQEWCYATGPVDIRRSEVFVSPDNVSQALDRGISTGATEGRPNSITYRAERYFLVDWDGQLQAAVLADRCRTTC